MPFLNISKFVGNIFVPLLTSIYGFAPAMDLLVIFTITINASLSQFKLTHINVLQIYSNLEIQNRDCVAI